MSGTHRCPRTSQNLCAKNGYKGISSTASLAHIDNCFPAGVATPRRRKNHGGARDSRQNPCFYNFNELLHRHYFRCTVLCHLKIIDLPNQKRNAHDQADAFYALNSILRPLHFVFSRMYLPGSNAQSPHGTWKTSERLKFHILRRSASHLNKI